MVADPSPLDTFVRQLRGLADGRKLAIMALPRSTATEEWRVLLDDIEMMLHENVVIGLRTPWVRRVAVPVFKAWCALKSGDGTPKSRAVTAMEILDQCRDTSLALLCCTWIRAVYIKEKTPAVTTPGSVVDE